MEGIEISFPLSVCRDILGDDTEKQQWHVYQASISPWEQSGKKTVGSLRARVVPSEAEKFVDLVLTFPRYTIRYPAVKGHLRCRIEDVKQLSESESGRSFSPGSKRKISHKQEKQLSQRQSIADDATSIPAACMSIGARRSKRPCRRREKPSKYKDYVAISDLSQIHKASKTENVPSSKAEIEMVRPWPNDRQEVKEYKSDTNGKTDSDHDKTTETRQTKKAEITVQMTPPIETQSVPAKPILSKSQSTTVTYKDQNAKKLSDHGHAEEEIVPTEPDVGIQGRRCSEKSEKKRTGVGKYNQLIKSLREASEKTGLEMLSILPRLKSDFGSKIKKTDSEKSESVHINSQQRTHLYSTGSKSNLKAVVDGKHSDVFDKVQATENRSNTVSGTLYSSNASKETSRTPLKTGNYSCNSSSSDQQKRDISLSVASEPIPKMTHCLTSFPRKFPSSLIRNSTVDMALSKTFLADTRKRQTRTSATTSSTSVQVGAILNRFKDTHSIHQGKMMVCESPEDNQEVSERDVMHSDPTPDSEKVLSLGSRAMSAMTAFPSLPPSRIVATVPVPAEISHVSESGSDNTNTTVLLTDGQGNHVSSFLLLASGDIPAGDKRVWEHDYCRAMQPGRKAQTAKALKTLVKPISFTQHISAHVEKVEQGMGSSLVTISGLNRNALPSNLLPVLRHNHEGLPIAECLEDAMTDAHRRRLDLANRYQLATVCEQGTPITVGIHDIPVISEITISPFGHLQGASTRHIGSGGQRGRPRKRHQPSSVRGVQYQTPTKNLEACLVSDKLSNIKSARTIFVDTSQFGTEVIQQLVKQDIRRSDGHENNAHNELTDTTLQERLGGSLIENSYCFPQCVEESANSLSQECLDQGWIGARLIAGEEIIVDECQEPRSNLDIAVDNEEVMRNFEQSSLGRFCRYCLRMFVGPLMLFKHVKSIHAGYSGIPEHQAYLQILKHNSCTVCPYCPGRHVLSNEYKLRAHLINFHGNQVDDLNAISNSTRLQCEVCQVHFHTLNELKAHATLLHNTDIWECIHCPCVFVREKSRGLHMSQSHGDHTYRSYTCKYCAESFDNELDLKTHKQAHGKPLKQQTRPKAGTLISTKHKLGRQTGTTRDGLRAGEEDIQCPCCADQFSALSHLQHHCHQVHTGPISTKCIFCGLGLDSLDILKQHVMTHLQGESNDKGDVLMLHCPYCQETAQPQTVFLLISHIMKKHGSHFPYQCVICQHSFQQEKARSDHYLEVHQQHSVTARSQYTASESAVISNLTDSVDLTTFAHSGEFAPDPVIQAETIPDLFGGLSTEDQIKLESRIQLITQGGKKALVTINDGKGCTQKVIFQPLQSSSVPNISSAACFYPATEPEWQTQCSEDSAAETVNMLIAQTPSTLETDCGANLSTDSGIAMEMEVTSSATWETTLGAAGFSSDMEVVISSASADETGGITGEVGGAGPTELLVLPDHMVYLTEGKEVLQHSEGQSEGVADTIETSDLSGVTSETEGSETLLLSADDFVKLFRDLQSATAGSGVESPSQ